jgi:hypothetical protein
MSVNKTDKVLSLILIRELSLMLASVCLRNRARMTGQRLVPVESVHSAQISGSRSATGMSVKTSYSIVLGIEGIPRKVKTQRDRFYESRESKRSKQGRFLVLRDEFLMLYVSRVGKCYSLLW